MKNEMYLEFEAIAVNESLARIAVAAFVAPLNPTLEELSDIKTAVSEAVTNAIVHAYGDQGRGKVVLRAALESDRVMIEVEDYGCGIDNIAQAMKPFYTSQPERERSGMGFSLMQSFMDGVEVQSVLGKGTKVLMKKLLDTDE